MRISRLALGLVVLLPLSLQAENLDALPEYQPHKLPAETLHAVGSDSMETLMERWAKSYQAHQPKLDVQVVSRGSATAPAALIEGTANLGHMARPMKTTEVQDFRRRYGFEPTQIRTALAGVVVFVSKDNPLSQISYQELDSIFSAERKRGGKAIEKWSQLGLRGPFKKDKIMALGRVEGTYPQAYFRQGVMLQADFNKNVTPMADSRSLFEAIERNPEAIGFADIASIDAAKNAGVKILAISREPGDPAITPTTSNLLAGNYPLSRFLNLYVVRGPGEQVDEATRDFIRFVLSQEGQEIVQRQGMMAMPGKLVAEELAKVN